MLLNGQFPNHMEKGGASPPRPFSQKKRGTECYLCTLTLQSLRLLPILTVIITFPVLFAVNVPFFTLTMLLSLLVHTASFSRRSSLQL